MILDFFIGFFGTIYYGTKLTHESINRKCTEREQEARRISYHSWVEQFTDPKLEREYKNMIADKSRYDEVWAMVQEDCEYIPEWKELGYVPITFHLNEKAYPHLSTSQGVKAIEQTRRNVLRLMMAHHGKILAYDSTGGLECNYTKYGTNLPALYDFMARLNVVSQENGGPTLLFKPFKTNEKPRLLQDNLFSEGKLVGSYVWESPYSAI